MSLQQLDLPKKMYISVNGCE